MVASPMSARSRPPSAAAAEERETYLRSWLGPQSDSRKANEPSFVFGTGDRSGAPLKQPEGNAKRSVGLSPGPIYNPSPRQGKLGSGPAFSIGGFVPQDDTRRAGAQPGPGEYEKPPSIGEESGNAQWRTAPKHGWGTGGRNKVAAGGYIGIAQKAMCMEFYELSAAVGPQYDARKANQPCYTQGLSPRFNDKIAQRKLAGLPGPGAYAQVSATTVQVDSTKPSGPRPSFSRANRFRRGDEANRNDNAGLVGDLRSANGRQVLSDRKSKPSYGFGSARRFNWDRPDSARGASGPGPGSYNA